MRVTVAGWNGHERKKAVEHLHRAAGVESVLRSERRERLLDDVGLGKASCRHYDHGSVRYFDRFSSDRSTKVHLISHDEVRLPPLDQTNKATGALFRCPTSEESPDGALLRLPIDGHQRTTRFEIEKAGSSTRFDLPSLCRDHAERALLAGVEDFMTPAGEHTGVGRCRQEVPATAREAEQEPHRNILAAADVPHAPNTDGCATRTTIDLVSRVASSGGNCR